jgi:uncharacterized membrane protein YcaP (DUF421 family)
MDKNSIHLGDFKRILLGDAPPEFLLEVFIRTLIIYVVLLFVVRLLGKRMSGQLTITEMAVMITLGAMVSVPMQMPDRGILQGVLVLICALLFHRGINLLGVKSQRFEKFSQGHLSTLVKNGVIQLDAMKDARMAKQELYALLRNKNIYNLGKVKRAYFEACGILSVFEEAQPRPGLPLLPQRDQPLLKVQSFPDDELLACCNCGNTRQGKEDNDVTCNVCGNQEWTKAID